MYYILYKKSSVFFKKIKVKGNVNVNTDSYASLLVEKNVPIVAISERLGHEDVQTTLNTYAHLYPQKQEEIANILSAFTI